MVSTPVGPFTNMPGDVLPEYTKTHRIMKDTVQFGFHPVGGRNAHFSRDLLVAGCCNHGGHAVCYGARPFRGRSEMEIQLIGVPYNDSISSHEREILLGLLKRPKGRGHIDSHNDVPRCSQDKPDTHFIVYQGYEVWDKRDPSDVKQKKYGYRTTLRFLRKNEKVGMQVTEDGDLYFYYDGVCQGLAASNVYLEGFDIYPFFELRGHVHVALITKACKLVLFLVNYSSLKHSLIGTAWNLCVCVCVGGGDPLVNCAYQISWKLPLQISPLLVVRKSSH